MENQVYHIQTLLVDELDSCKGRGNTYAEEYIKEIQDIYRQEDLVMKLMNLDQRHPNQLLSKTKLIIRRSI